MHDLFLIMLLDLLSQLFSDYFDNLSVFLLLLFVLLFPNGLISVCSYALYLGHDTAVGMTM